MKKILQAKVNVLIENNKILQEEREKRAQQKIKVKPQFSYSLYQQPSTIAEREEPKHIRFEESRQEDLDSEESGYSQKIYQKRLAYIERRRGETLTMQELLKERHYFKKILENMHVKISTLASEALQKRLKETKKGQHSKTKLKHSNSVNIDHSQITQYTNQTKQLKQSQRHKIVTNSELDASRLQLLNQQLQHLNRQKKKFQPSLSQIQNSQTQTPLIEGEKYKEIIELKQTVKIRKAEIKKMKQSIFKMGKYLITSEGNSPDKSLKIGQKENIKTEFEQESKCLDLKLDIESKRNQLIEKKKHFERLLENINKTKDNIQQVNSLLQQKAILNEKQTVHSFQQKQMLTQVTDHLPPIDRNHSTMSIVTTSSFSASIDDKYKYLIKKKQVLMNSIRTEGQKWKNVYNEKMRRLINEYSNIKDIHRVALKLENEKTMKEEEYQWLVNGCRSKEE